MEGSTPSREPAPERSRAAAPPLVLLAGSDSRPPRLTEAGRGYRALAGHKSAELRIEGRPLVRRILDRLLASDRFSDLYVAGPSRIYAGLVDGARLVDCDDRLEVNLRTAFEAVREDHPHGPIAFLASDLLPEEETIRTVMDRYADAAPCDVFFPSRKCRTRRPPSGRRTGSLNTGYVPTRAPPRARSCRDTSSSWTPTRFASGSCTG